MKKMMFGFGVMIALTGMAQADQLCGKLTGYCGNGWCNKMITPTYCLNGGDTCRDGASVKVVPENHKALDELNKLLNKGEDTRVCAEGHKDEAGVFHVSSAAEEQQ